MLARRLPVLVSFFVCALPLLGCGAGGAGGAANDAAPSAAQSAAALPVIALDELPAFPLEKHVESADIAAYLESTYALPA